MNAFVQFLPLLFVLTVAYLIFRYRAARKQSLSAGQVSIPGRFVPGIVLGPAAHSLAMPMHPRAFRNPANGYIEDIGTPWLWCLFFGCIYFAVRGIWTHAIAAALLAIITCGASLFVYPFFARQIVETHYLRRGWSAV
jgi:hypothetical protein